MTISCTVSDRTRKGVNVLNKNLIVISIVLTLIVASGLIFAEENELVLTLEQAVDYAEVNSPQIKMATEDLKAAEAEFSKAKSNLYPTLDATLTGTSESEVNPLTGSDEIYTSDLALTQNFALPIVQGYKLAKKSYQLNKFTYLQAREDLSFTVTQAFLGVCKAQEGIKIAQDSLALAEKNLKMTKAFFEAGLNVKTDVLKLELAVSQARQGLLAAENGYLTTLAGLKQVLGLAQDKDLKVLSPNTLPDFMFPEKLSPPYAQRYDWQQAALRVEIADLGSKIARAGYLPVAFIKYGYTDQDTEFSPEGGSTGLTLGIKWSLSLGGANRAVIKNAEAQLEKTRLRQDSAQQAAITEVLQAQLAYKETQKRKEISELSLKIAEENSLLAQKRYEAGVGTTLEVSDAQVDLEQARFGELTARYDLYLAGVKLQKALGLYRRSTTEGGDNNK
jgi:outer membrane protein